MDKCEHCGALAVSEQKETCAAQISAKQSVEFESLFFACAHCEEQWMTSEQLDKNAKAQVKAKWAALDAPPVEQLIAWRKRWGLTQATASALIGAGPMAFHKYEKGILAPSQPTARLLSVLLDSDAAVVSLAKIAGVELNDQEATLSTFGQLSPPGGLLWAPLALAAKIASFSISGSSPDTGLPSYTPHKSSGSTSLPRGSEAKHTGAANSGSPAQAYH